MGEIKKDKRFKNINFEKIKLLNNILEEAEKIKIDLSCEEEEDFFIPSLNGKDDFKLEIKRSEFEELCIYYGKNVLK